MYGRVHWHGCMLLCLHHACVRVCLHPPPLSLQEVERKVAVAKAAVAEARREVEASIDTVFADY